MSRTSTNALPPLARFRRSTSALLRTWQGRLILLLVAVPLLAPLHYYLRHRDPHDERFSWRMFSPMRMTACTVRALVDRAPIPLEREFHEAWLGLARRGRFSVVEAMGAQLCAKNPNKAVVFHLECTYAGKPPARFGGFNMCNIPAL